jgi:hypothetical protein
MGMALHPDGSTYAGQYYNGARHGVGVYTRYPDETTEDIHAGEWREGRRHGFAIERTRVRKRVLRNALLEYDGDVAVASEALEAREHEAWFEACEKAAMRGKSASFQAQAVLPKLIPLTLVMTQQARAPSRGPRRLDMQPQYRIVVLHYAVLGLSLCTTQCSDRSFCTKW